MLAIAVPLSYNLTLTLLPGHLVGDAGAALHTFTASQQLRVATTHATTVFLLHAQGMQFSRISIAQAWAPRLAPFESWLWSPGWAAARRPRQALQMLVMEVSQPLHGVHAARLGCGRGAAGLVLAEKAPVLTWDVWRRALQPTPVPAGATAA